MTCGIYKIENKINGMVYIGRSSNIEERIHEHKKIYKSNKRKKYLYDEMNKYGIDNFDFSVLEECPKEETYEKEMYYIQKYDSYKNGYNKTHGGKDGMCSSLEDNIGEIVHLLKNTEMPIFEIANKFDVTDALISMINNGKRCFLKNEDYPIRKTNIHEENKCADCGKPITLKAERCRDCYVEHKRKSIPPKEELLENVLNTSFEQTGRDYGVSGNTIKKWLKYYDEPFKKEDLLNKYKPKEIKIRKTTKKKIDKIEMSKDGNKIIFENINDCIEHLLILFDTNKRRCREGIQRVLNNRRKTYHGYMFRYVK